MEIIQDLQKGISACTEVADEGMSTGEGVSEDRDALNIQNFREIWWKLKL